MSNYHNHDPDELLERFLDGLLEGDELQDFEQRLSTDEELQAAVEQHQRFEEQVRACFEPREVSVDGIERLLATAAERSCSQPTATTTTSAAACAPPASNRHGILIVAAIAIAAMVAWIAVAFQFRGRPHVEAHFEQRPLVSLYRESVAQGFRPYYFCEDPDRFARTFLKRQRVPLLLDELPQDRRMVGLSYLGGISRDTTAMLAFVAEKPVVVFVDRKELDHEPRVSQRAAEDQLYVHRFEVGDLVLYEVSPFDEPTMTPYLKLVPAKRF